MESWLNYLFTTLSSTSLLIAVVIISFLESLAIIGLILPGIILMSSLGTLIGNGKILFYSAWISGTIGCILGDWISYYLGWKFKYWIYNLNILKKYLPLLKKTKNALYQHSFYTILIGKFIGPTRSIVPMVSGMLKLPIKKFLFPNIIGCVFWPPIYFLPGILAGMTIKNCIPEDQKTNLISFKWLLTLSLLLIWIGIRAILKSLDKKKPKLTMFYFLPIKSVFFIGCILLIFGIITVIAIQFNPNMIILRKLIWKIIIS